MSTRKNLPKLDPTDPEVFMNRRRFVRNLGLGAAGCAVGGAMTIKYGSWAFGQSGRVKAGDALKPPFARPEVFPAKRNPAFSAKELSVTPRTVAATHNNFYEFLPGEGGPVYKYVGNFVVEPWKVEVSGLCEKPMTFDLDDLFKFEHEERVYHFRCVETWSMNVPWSGFPLKKLLEKVEPKSEAKYVRFVSANRPNQMPGIEKGDYYEWPYFEALRMDEAMNDLTLIATGIDGKPLLKQHGSPVRIVCPWKYGYKNPKSIVKIELVESKPRTFWTATSPSEYGFLSNVNPNIPHPRWSQAQEYALGNRRKRNPTKIFNGYGEFVAKLYPDEPTTPLAIAPNPPR